MAVQSLSKSTAAEHAATPTPALTLFASSHRSKSTASNDSKEKLSSLPIESIQSDSDDEIDDSDADDKIDESAAIRAQSLSDLHLTLHQLAEKSRSLQASIRSNRSKLSAARQSAQSSMQSLQSDATQVHRHGLSLLDCKSTLLLQYVQRLNLITQQRCIASRRSDSDADSQVHSQLNDRTVSQLIHLRVCIERMRPIDKKMAYQIHKLCTEAHSRSASTATATPRATPRASGSQSEMIQQSQSQRSVKSASTSINDIASNSVAASSATDLSLDLHKPRTPHLVPGMSDIESQRAYEEAERAQRKKRSEHERHRLKLTKSTRLAQLRAQVDDDAPEAISYGLGADDVARGESTSGVHEKYNSLMNERTEFEESNMMRLMDSHEQKSLAKKVSRTGMLQGLDDFNDLKTQIYGGHNGPTGARAGGAGMQFDFDSHAHATKSNKRKHMMMDADDQHDAAARSSHSSGKSKSFKKKKGNKKQRKSRRN